MAEKTYSYYENLLNNPRVQAALNTVSFSDGVLDHPGVKDPYGTRYGYSTFDYSGWHPNDTISKGRYTSSAVGKYQAMRYSFAPLAAELGIPNINAKNQDIFALALIDQVPGALNAALKGDARTFADKTKGLWTSLPGGSQSKSKGKGTAAVERHRQQIEKAFSSYLDKATKNPSTLGGLSMDAAAKQRAETGAGYVERRSPTEQAQTQLAGLGYQPGAINGVYGNWVGRTNTRSGRPQLNEPLRAAIGAFQSDYNIPFTQQLDQKTLDTLGAQAKAQDARDARLGSLPTGKSQQNMVRPTGPNVGGMPRNPLFPEKVIAPTQRPNVAPAVNPAVIQRMQDNLTSKMAFALPNPSNMNISGYGFSTPANPGARGSATGSINRASAVGNLAVPGRSGGVLGGRGNINPPNVVAPPANALPNFDQYGNFTGNRQSSKAPTIDFRSTLAERAAVPQAVAQRTPTVSTWGGMANAPVVQSPSSQAMLGPTNDPSVRAAQADLAERNRRDQFARDLIKSMPAPAQTDAARLASQYSQYQRGTVPSAQINPSVYDMVDVPQSNTIAAQYASYGAGKIAPQAAATATQSIPAAPQTTTPRAPSINVPGPVGVQPQMTQQQRLDKAIADMKIGIPPRDIYREQLNLPVAPGRSGFRGFGAGGFLGNLLTGNIGNMQGIEGGNRLPGVLGILQSIVQGVGNPNGMANAGGNGGLSAGAANAGWSANNPERNYGGYGSGIDPTPV